MGFKNVRDVGLGPILVHECVVTLSVASGYLYLSDVSAICLLADVAGVYLLHEVSLDPGSLIHKKLSLLKATAFEFIVTAGVAELKHHINV